MKKQIAIIGIIILLNGISILSSPGSIAIDRDLTSNDEAMDFECYGFVIPLPAGDDSTYETFLNSKVRCLVNDLLRENITVYWSSCDFSVLSKEMQNDGNSTMIFYKKGAFVVPFSGDLYKDALATALVYDYNMTSEIDVGPLKLEVYKLVDPINMTGYVLQEAKIVQYLGRPIRYHWPVYLQVAESGGFFSMEFLLDDEITGLSNDDFNVFMWPYQPNPATTLDAIKPLTNTEGLDAIRKFVRNGGGYIGSCYGAQVATSGNIRPIPFNFLRYAYNPNLSFCGSFGFLALSDSLAVYRAFFKPAFYAATIELTDTSHPLAFGLNKTVKDLWAGVGIGWVGENTEIVGIYNDLSNKDDPFINRGFIKKMIGSPAYLSTTFGDGKVVFYTSHPEMINNISLLSESYTWEGDRYYGRRILHNTLFYVASKGLRSTITEIHYPVSFIEDLGFRTTNLYINQSGGYEFQNLITRINMLNTDLYELDNISIELNILISGLFPDIIEKTRIEYMHHFCNIYSDYNNKTLSSLNKLGQIYPMLFEYNESILSRVNSLKSELSWRLNYSESLVQKVIVMANNLKDLMQFKKHILQKLETLQKAQEMLRAFETGLKYIPQTYFETEKLVRYSWYNYEADIALDF